MAGTYFRENPFQRRPIAEQFVSSKHCTIAAKSIPRNKNIFFLNSTAGHDTLKKKDAKCTGPSGH